MLPSLEQANFRVDTFNYPNWEGPYVTMAPDNTGLSATIVALCLDENKDGFA
jgi:hypothetical protein